MPRQARLDAPGTLRHVMIRGIEGAKGRDWGSGLFCWHPFPFPYDPTYRSKMHFQMISNLPLAITVSLHRLLEDVSWGSNLHMSRKLLPEEMLKGT